jgi:hypothetical protein
LQKIGVPVAFKANYGALSFNINIRVLKAATKILKLRALFGENFLEILMVIVYKIR